MKFPIANLNLIKISLLRSIFLLIISSIFLQCSDELDFDNDPLIEDTASEFTRISADNLLVQKALTALDAREDQVNQAIEKGVHFDQINFENINYAKVDDNDFVYIPLKGDYNGSQLVLVAVSNSNNSSVKLMFQESPFMANKNVSSDLIRYHSLDFEVYVNGGKPKEDYVLTNSEINLYPVTVTAPVYVPPSGPGIYFPTTPGPGGPTYPGRTPPHGDGVGGGGGGGGGGSSGPRGKVKFGNQNTNPCVGRILKKLQEKDLKKLTVPNIGGLSGTSHLSEGILRLFDKMDNLDLIFEIDEAGTNKNATTRVRAGFGAPTIVITLDEEFVKNATQLGIARTIIHESVHAFLLYATGKYSTSETAEILKVYREKYDNSLDIAHHKYMTQFAEAIGKSLSVWDNNQLGEEYYNNLAWSGGMITSEEFDELKTDQQNAIKDANEAEGNANQKSKTNAKGKRCD